MGDGLMLQNLQAVSPCSRVTLALGQSNLYKPERDRSGMQPSVSEFSVRGDECRDHVACAKGLVYFRAVLMSSSSWLQGWGGSRLKGECGQVLKPHGYPEPPCGRGHAA